MFEPPRPKRNVTQCGKCQGYVHTQAYCYHSPRCVKCADNHSTKHCHVKKNQNMSSASFATETIRPTIKDAPFTKKYRNVPFHQWETNLKVNPRRPTPIIHQTWHIVLRRAHITTTTVRDCQFKYPKNIHQTTENPPTTKWNTRTKNNDKKTHGTNEHNVTPINNCRVQNDLNATQNSLTECQWTRPAYRRIEKLYTKPTIRYHANIGNTLHHKKLL
jgi:hypothetical protein